MNTSIPHRLAVFSLAALALTLLLCSSAYANSGNSALLFRPALGILLLLPVILIERSFYRRNGIEEAQLKSTLLNVASLVAGSILAYALYVLDPKMLWYTPAMEFGRSTISRDQALASLSSMCIAFVINFAFSVGFEGIIATKLYPSKFSGLTWTLVFKAHLFSYTCLGLALLADSIGYLAIFLA